VKTFRIWFFRILWWLTFVAIVLVIIVIVNREWIVKELVERQIRKDTGMNLEIGDFSFSVLDSKVTLNNSKLYNPADFGGTLFLDMPEVHIEYDRAALRRHELHITFMRVNLRELDVVKNAAGATNLMSIINKVEPRQRGGRGRKAIPLNGCQFTGIDVLNISIGTVKFIDLKNQMRNRTLAFGIRNQTIPNVRSPADFIGLESMLWLRGGYWVGLPGSRLKHPAGAITVNTTGTNAVNAAGTNAIGTNAVNTVSTNTVNAIGTNAVNAVDTNGVNGVKAP
jgi:hypothetical protein